MQLSTFSETSKPITVTEPETTTVPEVVVTPEPITETTTTANEPATVVPEAVVPEPTQENELAFDLMIGEEKPVITQENTPTQPNFNWKEEIKKIDQKELIAELGLTDFAVELNEYLKKGGKASDYLAAKAIDYTKYSDEEILKESIRTQYAASGQTISAKQVDLLFQRKYTIDEDASDDDKELMELQVKTDANNIRQSKIQEQAKFKIPDTPILQTDEAYEQWKEQQQNNPKLMEQLRNYYDDHAATKALNESKKVAISFGEGVAPLNFKIDQPQIITQSLTAGGVILNKIMTTPTGEPDVAKQQLITLIAFNPQKFIQDVFNYGRKMGVHKELVEEGQNAAKPQAVVANMGGNQPATYKTGTYGGGAQQ